MTAPTHAFLVWALREFEEPRIIKICTDRALAEKCREMHALKSLANTRVGMEKYHKQHPTYPFIMNCTLEEYEKKYLPAFIIEEYELNKDYLEK